MKPAWSVCDDGILLHIRLTPNARKSELGQITNIDDTAHALSARVTARPEKGKANTALIALLAKQFKRPKSSILLEKGHASRLKTVRIRVEGEAKSQLTRQLEAWPHERNPD
ncbi:DUF167 domain-containing protein [Maricaulis sp. D1M11]|uniref:DUF167 domain-containing protein n=1 Tax=Maricaulis sp. D1M11 TaxID=3076117 RepID=UPI0039B6A65A